MTEINSKDQENSFAFSETWCVLKSFSKLEPDYFLPKNFYRYSRKYRKKPGSPGFLI